MSTQTEAISLPGGPIAYGVIAVLTAALAIGIVTYESFAVVGLFGLFVFLFFCRFPVLGIYATTAVLLLQGATGVIGLVNEGAPLAITAAQLVGISALGAWIVNLLLGKNPFVFNMPMILLGGFVLWSLFGTILATEFDQEFPHWIRLLTRFGFLVLAVNVMTTPRRLHYYVFIVLACGAIMAVVAVMQYFLPQWQVAGAQAWAQLGNIDAAYIDQESLQGEAAIRVSGRAGHSNWLAMIILLILPLNAYFFTLFKNRIIQGLIILLVGIELVSLVLTFTRTGMIIGVTLAFLLILKRLFKITPARICAGLLVLGIAWTLLPGPYKERVFNPEQYVGSRSVQSRLQLQESAAYYWKENPVFGLGIGGFGTEFIRENNQTAATMEFMVRHHAWEPVFIGTHNMYLQLLADSGTIGFLLFAAFYILILRDLLRAEAHYREEGDKAGEMLCSALIVSLVGFMLCAVFLHALQQHIWWIVAAAAIAVPAHKMEFKADPTFRPVGAAREVVK